MIGQRNHNLDLLRGLAALEVCSSHLRNFLFANFSSVHSPNIAARLFYFITGFGHQAVIIFFVLSGYLVGGSVIKAYVHGKWSWCSYAVRRLSRLWIVMIPALLLTFAIDSLGRKLGHSGYVGEFFNIYKSGPKPEAAADLRLIVMLGNVLFLQTITVPCFGTNEPLWSLANEFWYYVLFPVLCGLLFRIKAMSTNYLYFRRLVAVAAYSLLVGVIISWLPAAVVYSGASWLLGVAAFLAVRTDKLKRLLGQDTFLFISLGLFGCYTRVESVWLGVRPRLVRRGCIHVMLDSVSFWEGAT